MPMDVYVPNDVDIIHQTKVDFRKRTTQSTVHLVQYERSLPVVEVELFYNGYSYTCPNDAEVWVRWSKLDNTYVYKRCQVSADRKKVYFDVDYQMSYLPGDLNPILELQIGTKMAGSSPIPISIDRNPVQDSDRESHVEDLQVEILREEVAELREEIENINLIEITYSELRTLKNSNNLTKGQLYKITDYITTTAQSRTRSVGHPFDIIVRAVSSNTFSEVALACHHSGDTYFANSKLEAWAIRYCFDNDTNRFAWADATNGKGVIYYLKDEFDNIAHYDFKNIQFARYKVTACEKATSLVGKYLGVIDIEGDTVLSNHMTIDNADIHYYYTFDCCGSDYSLNNIGETLTRPDGSTFTLDQIQCQDCFIDMFSHDSSLLYLNNVTCIVESSKDMTFKIGWDSRDSTVIGGASSVEIKDHLSHSIIGCTGSTFIDGYIGQHSSIRVVQGSLVIQENYAVQCFQVSTIGPIINSTLINNANFSLSYYSQIHYIGSCNIKTNRSIFENTTINVIANCNITSDYRAFYYSTINAIVGCNGEVSRVYCGYALIEYVFNISINTSNNEKPDWYISYVNITTIYDCSISKMASVSAVRLEDCSFKDITNCVFTDVRNVTCNQKLLNSSLHDARYLNISTSNTSQDINSINIHNVRGDSNNIRNLVINEDFSTPHTVSVYGPGTKEIILD